MNKGFLFSVEQINRLFPFYILIARDFTIKSVGHSLSQIMDLRAGDNITKIFGKNIPEYFFHPFEELSGQYYQLVATASENDTNPILLQGELEYLSSTNELLLLGAPGVKTAYTTNVSQSPSEEKPKLNDLFLGTGIGKVKGTTLSEFRISEEKEVVMVEALKGVAITDKDGKIEWVSQDFERTTGYLLKDIIGLRPRDVVYGQKSTYIPSSYVDEMVKLKKPFSFDNIGYNKYKRSFWFRTTVQPILDEQNEVKGRYYYFEDVTEIKSNENALKDSQELWKFALEGAGDGVWAFNIPNRELQVSSKFMDLLGYVRTDKFGADDLKESMNETDFNALWDILSNKLKVGESTFSFETIITTKDKTKKFYKIRGKVKEWDDKSKPLVIFGTITDTNEEKVKDIELKQLANRLSTLIENFNSGVLLEDENRNILLVNNMFCDIFSVPVSPKDLVGVDCSGMAEQSKSMFVNPDAFVQRVNSILEGKVSVTDDILYMADGRILERDYIPIFIEGAYSGHLWKYNDITERKRLEINLKNSEARLSALINNFKAGVMFEDRERSIMFANRAFCRLIIEELMPEFLIGENSVNSLKEVKYLFTEPDKFVADVEQLVSNHVPVLNGLVTLVDGRVLKRDFIPVVVDEEESGYLWIYEDITKQLEIENKVMEQREYFHRILNELPADIMIISVDQKFEFINKSAVVNDEMREWLIGKDMYDYCRRKNISNERAVTRDLLFREALATRKSVSSIDQHIKPDGTLKYMLRFLYPFLKKNGTTDFVVGFGIDITEQVNSENEIKAQKEYYHEILNEIPADIVIFSLDHKYRFINKNAVKNPQIREWLIGRDDYEYCDLKGVDYEMADNRRKMFTEAVSQKQPVSLVDEVKQLDGTVISILRIMYPNIDAEGNVKSVIGYGIDITEQIENKRIAELQGKQMGNLLNIIRDGVFTFAPDGNIILSNNSFRNIMTPDFNKKWSPDDNYNFFDFLSEEEYANVTQKLTALASEGAPQSGIVRLKNNDGVEKYLDYTFTKSMENVNATFVGRISDITAIVNKERGLTQIIEKEKELNNSKSQFIRITSHELRTPLAIIQANAEILEMINSAEFAGAANLKPEVMIGRIVKEVKLMTEILNELMMISRIETGNIEFSPETVNVLSFVSGIRQDLYNPHTDGRILVLEVDEDVKTAYFDKGIMRHAIVNLVNNAFKYSTGKQAPALRVTIDSGELKFEVQDWGIGIPEEDQAKLFTSFFRASNAGVIQGTGLGLTVLDYAVKKHSGKIEFVSKVNEGSIFRILLPKEK